jgi:hypothetical protein
MLQLFTPDTYEPRAVFSPSGLSKARRCLHAWGLRYLLGIKMPEPTWAEACAWVKPEPKKKSKPTPEERAALKAYNSPFRKALGKECHARLETYFRGGNIDWNDRVGRIVLAGMHLIPHPDTCEKVEAEGEITIEIDGVKFRGFRDLLVLKDGRWLLIDHKTTFGFDYFDREKTQRSVKTSEQLIADPQANLYAFDVMRREGLRELACRWVYYRTEDKPKALEVDFTITWEGAAAMMAELVAEARALTAYVEHAQRLRANDAGSAVVRLAIVYDLQRNPDACADFGGCEYHAERGGTCTPPELSAGDKLKRQAEKRKQKAAQPAKAPTATTKGTKKMGFRDKVNAEKNKSTSEAAEGPADGAETGADAAGQDAGPDPREEAVARGAVAQAASSAGRKPRQAKPAGNLAQLAANLAETEAAFEAAKVAMREALS